MKKLTCTCGTSIRTHGTKNCTCPKCGKEYYYSKSLGKWLYAHRTHKAKGGMISEERMRV